MSERGDGGARIAYLMSWYPAVTETFILNEMLELHRSGVDLAIYPLLGAAQDVRHGGAEELADTLAREPVRLYLYSLATAVVGLLVILGVVEESMVLPILALVSALLAVPLTETLRSRVSPTDPKV